MYHLSEITMDVSALFFTAFYKSRTKKHPNIFAVVSSGEISSTGAFALFTEPSNGLIGYGWNPSDLDFTEAPNCCGNKSLVSREAMLTDTNKQVVLGLVCVWFRGGGESTVGR